MKNSLTIIKRITCTYLHGGCRKNLELSGPGHDGAFLEIDQVSPAPGEQIITVRLQLPPTQKSAEMLGFSLELNPGALPGSTMLANGFQSWSRSEDLGADEKISPLFYPARPFLAACGDSYLHNYSGKKGRHHSWSYTFFNQADGSALLCGSLNENSGYSLFEYDFQADLLRISKDCAGSAVTAGTELISFYMGSGSPDLLFDQYFALMKSTRPEALKATGWCSWYNYYTAVSEKIINDNLSALSRRKLPLDYFQIDDGWQKAIGDWLEPNEKFPAGMQVLCKKIKDHGFRPGLWLAPFICVPSSDLYKQHPQWLLRDSRGKPVRAGYNPGWEGFFYALDFYADGFRDHLRRVFERAQQQWGFNMLKLDFLYAAALIPRDGKSRGQIMAEAVNFIDQHTGCSSVLGCGVPLHPSFGKFDYCRIGSDVGPYWEDYLKRLNYRERVSTENSLACTISRRQLDRRAFRNDPDVFILRDGTPGANENRMSSEQRYTLFFLNNLLGGLVFFSDNVGELTAEQLQILQSGFPAVETLVGRHENSAGLHRFSFSVNSKSYLSFTNLSSLPKKIAIPAAEYFHPEHFVLYPNSQVALEPYQSLCLYRIEKKPDQAYFLGAAGHIYPGAQVEKLGITGNSAFVKLHRHSSPQTVLYLALPSGCKSFMVNGRAYSALKKNDLNYIKIPLSELEG